MVRGRSNLFVSRWLFLEDSAREQRIGDAGAAPSIPAWRGQAFLPGKGFGQRSLRRRDIGCRLADRVGKCLVGRDDLPPRLAQPRNQIGNEQGGEVGLMEEDDLRRV